MAVPTQLSDLSATAASNSPAGSDTVGTTMDDYLRAHASIIARIAAGTDKIAPAGVTGTAAVLSQIREKLTAARTYYVRTDGSDSNTGLANNAGGAFLTIQKAVDTVSDSLDLSGYDVVIQVADGTYTAGATASGPWVGEGNVYILGNTTTPANCIINTTSADCFFASEGATFSPRGFKITTTTSGAALKAYLNSYISFQKIDFGACAASHIECGTSSAIIADGNYSIAGGAVSHMHCGSPGAIVHGTITVTITGTPAFSAYFAGVAQGSITCMTTTWTGSATGVRFLAHKGGVIDVGAGTITTLPGDVAGYSDVGGVYACTTGTQDAQYFGGPSTAPAFEVVPVSGQDNHLVATASNGGNPTLSASGGNIGLGGAVVCAGSIQSLSGQATPAGGGVGLAWLIGSGGIGIYFGSGAPSVSAARGSLYLRTDNGANTSLYINRDGGTTWAAVTSA